MPGLAQRNEKGIGILTGQHRLRVNTVLLADEPAHFLIVQEDFQLPIRSWFDVIKTKGHERRSLRRAATLDLHEPDFRNTLLGQSDGRAGSEIVATGDPVLEIRHLLGKNIGSRQHERYRRFHKATHFLAFSE
nr:hypothetical protein [Sinorhizobium fredii]